MNTKHTPYPIDNGDEDILDIPEVKMPCKEEILMREDDLLEGLFMAIEEKEGHDITKRVVIQRQGKKLFEFDIRPLDEKELLSCRKKSTKYFNNPQGKNLPKVEGDTDVAKLRSLKIYMATTDEYRTKLWDNPRVQERFNVITGYDVIDLALLAGEKDAVIDQIDDLSGFGVSVEEYAKN